MPFRLALPPTVSVVPTDKALVTVAELSVAAPRVDKVVPTLKAPVTEVRVLLPTVVAVVPVVFRPVASAPPAECVYCRECVAGTHSGHYAQRKRSYTKFTYFFLHPIAFNKETKSIVNRFLRLQRYILHSFSKVKAGINENRIPLSLIGTPK